MTDVDPDTGVVGGISAGASDLIETDRDVGAAGAGPVAVAVRD